MNTPTNFEGVVTTGPQLVIPQIFKRLEYLQPPVPMEIVNNWLLKHQLKLGPYFNGDWIHSPSHNLDLFYQKQRFCSIKISDTEEIKNALHSAFNAVPKWRVINRHERSKHLYNICKVLEEKQELLTIVESLSFNKMIYKTKQDFPYLMENAYQFAGLADIWKIEMFTGVFALVLNSRQNPMISAFCHTISALASGHCILLIPKASTCLSTLLFAEICHLSGLPPGVVNVFPFETEDDYLKILHCLCTWKVLNEDSHDTLEIYSNYESKLYYDTIKEKYFDTRILNVKQDLCSMTPPTAIILMDADLNSAVVGILELFCSKNAPANTLCSILVQDSVRDLLICKLQFEFNKIQMGSCLSGAEIAPLADFCEEPIIKNEEFHFQVMNLKCPEDHFYNNLYTLDTEKSANKQVLKLTLSSFRTTKEVVEKFNSQNMRQNVSIWSETLATVLEVARQLKANTVWVNSQNTFIPVSFGGGLSHFDTSIQQSQLSGVKHPKKFKSATVGQIWDCDSYGIIRDDKISDRVICENPNILSQTKLFYGGKFKDSLENEVFDIYSSIGKRVGSIAKACTKDVNLAVASARTSQTKWENTCHFERSNILRKLSDCLEKSKTKFSTILENCDYYTSIEEILKEVEASIHCLRQWSTYCSKPGGVVQNTRIHGFVLKNSNSIGIISIICPDKPALLPFVLLLSSAISEKNVIIIIPSRIYPLPALEMCNLFQEAGVPPGVINVLNHDVDKVCRDFAFNMQVDAIWLHHFSCRDYAFLQKYAKLHKKTLWVPESILWLDEINLDYFEFSCNATFIKNIYLPTAELL